MGSDEDSKNADSSAPSVGSATEEADAPADAPIHGGNQSPRRRRRNRSRDPSISSQDRQTAANNERRSREKIHSASSGRRRKHSRSPSSSPEGFRGQRQTAPKVVGFADPPELPEWGPIGTDPESVRGETEKNKSKLDVDNPGDWALKHHWESLIVELIAPKIGLIESTFGPVLRKIREIKEGRRRPDVPQTSSSSTTTTTRTSSGNTISTTVTTVTTTTSSAHISSGDGRRFRISFAELQRMRIRKLQCELVRHVAKMRREGHESKGWEDTLKEYIKALQDHDYMEKRSVSKRDPFLATGEYAADNYVLNRNIDTVLADDHILPEPSFRKWEPYGDGVKRPHEPITGTRSSNINKTWHRGFRERVGLAALGGILLLGPMWLMVLQGGRFTPLIATTVCVTAFGLLMAYMLEEGKDVLASTAAYAAVLVVFVGSSSTPPAAGGG